MTRLTTVYNSSLQVFALLSVKKLTNAFCILCKPYICAKYFVQDSKALSKNISENDHFY